MAGGSSASAATKEAATEFHKHSPKTVYFYLFALILAYFAKYFCTSFLYVVQALWMKDQGIGKPSIQTMFIFGYGMSMIGKRAAGKWCDAWGGKNVQMLSLCAYIPCVILFSFAGRFCEAFGIEDHFPVFFSLWMFNGFFALGLSWVAIMVCASNWMPAHMEGRLLAIVGCAPELGDASARLYLGPIIKHGWGGLTVLGFGAAGDWSTVSLSAALAAVLLSAPLFIFVKESPLGYEEEKKAELKKAGGGQLDATLMTLTCTMCGLLYAVRTMFLLDSVLWLNTVYCTHYEPNTPTLTCSEDPATVGNVASASLLFTFLACFPCSLVAMPRTTCPKQSAVISFS
jgi:hypothetical protein